MQVLIMRHGYAEMSTAALSDDNRRLTPEGAALARGAGGGLREIVPELDLIITSSLLRARQTGLAVGEAYGIPPAQVLSKIFLAYNETVTYFKELQMLAVESVLCVGHMPAVSRFVQQALPARAFERAFSPTAVAILEFNRSVLPRTAVLRGYYTGADLAMLDSAKRKEGSY